MKVTFLMCAAAALLPVIAAAQSAGTQPARQRSDSVETRDKVDGSRTENSRQRADANSPGKSENAKGKKGEAPGQEKKSQSKDKNKSKNKK